MDRKNVQILKYSNKNYVHLVLTWSRAGEKFTAKLFIIQHNRDYKGLQGTTKGLQRTTKILQRYYKGTTKDYKGATKGLQRTIQRDYKGLQRDYKGTTKDYKKRLKLTIVFPKTVRTQTEDKIVIATILPA